MIYTIFPIFGVLKPRSNPPNMEGSEVAQGCFRKPLCILTEVLAAPAPNPATWELLLGLITGMVVHMTTEFQSPLFLTDLDLACPSNLRFTPLCPLNSFLTPSPHRTPFTCGQTHMHTHTHLSSESKVRKQKSMPSLYIYLWVLCDFNFIKILPDLKRNPSTLDNFTEKNGLQFK